MDRKSFVKLRHPMSVLTKSNKSNKHCSYFLPCSFLHPGCQRWLVSISATTPWRTWGRRLCPCPSWPTSSWTTCPCRTWWTQRFQNPPTLSTWTSAITSCVSSSPSPKAHRSCPVSTWPGIQSSATVTCVHSGTAGFWWSCPDSFRKRQGSDQHFVLVFYFFLLQRVGYL